VFKKNEISQCGRRHFFIFVHCSGSVLDCRDFAFCIYVVEVVEVAMKDKEMLRCPDESLSTRRGFFI
jgi:hypothetical protein